MKHIIAALIVILSALLLLFAIRFFFGVGIASPSYAADKKPVLYLYPKEETDVHVRLDYKGQLTCTYPAYEDGWSVTAAPDGTLTDENGNEYYCLFWEGISDTVYDLSAGYCIAGCETAAFLEDILPKLGLNAKEVNEFIIYWLPEMQDNAYNLISFQGKTYTDVAALDITPTPDTVIRVFMAWKALDAAVEIPEPVLPAAPARDGFTAVEWGGTEIVE